MQSLLPHVETEAQTERLGTTEGVWNSDRVGGQLLLSATALVPRRFPTKSLCQPFLGPFSPPLWSDGWLGGQPGTMCCPRVCAAQGLAVPMLLSPCVCIPSSEVCHSTAARCPQPGSSHPLEPPLPCLCLTGNGNWCSGFGDRGDAGEPRCWHRGFAASAVPAACPLSLWPSLQ